MSASSTALSTGIPHPSSQAAEAAALDSAFRAGSRLFSIWACSTARKGCAQHLAQSRRRSRQPQRTLGLQLGGRGAGKAFQQASDPALVSQLLEDPDALPIERLRCGIVHLVAGQISQVSE